MLHEESDEEGVKKVLIITYYWPPAGGPGVQRWLKFAKYLKQERWLPIVLTVDNGTYQAFDKSLIKEAKDLIVYKTKTLEPYKFFNGLRGSSKSVVEEMSGDLRSVTGTKQKVIASLSNFIRSNFFIPDARKYWKKYAVSKAAELINQHKIDTIVTTGPPHSTHLIGLTLKHKLGIKWLVDFRDPWVGSVTDILLKPLGISVKLNRYYEKKVIAQSDSLIVVSQGMKEQYAQKSSNIHVIYNGYDEEDFSYTVSSKNSNPFTLSYIGNFKIMQNNESLWGCISQLITEEEISPNHFVLKFTGNVNAQVIKSLDNHGLNKYIQFAGYKPHKEAVKNMMEANLLLFLNSELPGIGKYISGKIFEYLASGTPILAIAPQDGDVNKLLISCKRERAYGFREMLLFKNSLLNHYNNWANNIKNIDNMDTRYISQYSRRSQTKKLSIVLNNLT